MSTAIPPGLCASLCFTGAAGHVVWSRSVASIFSLERCDHWQRACPVAASASGMATSTEPDMLLACSSQMPTKKLCSCREGNNGHW
ncbi:hypothetical protein DICSQDRAFT_181735 [Dichomitus squalens LYAD-421 SS1]|uniref:Uncharacterized protein n=1 Tax=Dichomitus squalens (strain LYAD-421) TaxID=732165 RepID=R7SV37_DICSQ|nr:uncharacterized protein DICSQDRAFT_181735 [Dichomitus squalens LYAD-421 SS1]EJF59758.1 hypothetical protein DICSQDRAFT_181735 [Dichomitus squalens LYAD-421 SS1]